MKFQKVPLRSRRWLAMYFFCILAVVVILALPGRGGAETANLRYSWNPPLQGTPVVHYVVQIEYNSNTPLEYVDTYSEVTETYYDFVAERGMECRARVAGVDAQGRQGPWSGWTIRHGPIPPDPTFGFTR